MGRCWVLEGTQPPADKHCQLAEGPYSSAMCSHPINRTHSLHQVQQAQNLSLGHLVFSSYPYLCQLKRLYYDANCETTLLPFSIRFSTILCKPATVLHLCFLSEEIFTKRPEQKSCAWFGLLEHILKRART